MFGVDDVFQRHFHFSEPEGKLRELGFAFGQEDQIDDGQDREYENQANDQKNNGRHNALPFPVEMKRGYDRSLSYYSMRKKKSKFRTRSSDLPRDFFCPACFLSECPKYHLFNGFFRIFSAFLQLFIISSFENMKNACIFLYRISLHTDRTREPPAPFSGPARGEKELHT